MKYLEIGGLVLILCVVLALVAGCTLNRPYRTGFNPTDPTLPGPNPTNSPIEIAAGYSLGFVEFDDQGWFWDPIQKTNVEKLIRKECGLDTSNESAVIMVLFVHGWKNNAAFSNSNVETFRTVLTQLSDLEKTLSEKQGTSPRKVIGVYAGWRGLSTKSDYLPPLGKELTFWSRKSTAQRVGGYGAMTELMMDLEELQRSSNKHLPTNAPQSKLIIVGHSFGADAVFNAISQIVTERFVDTIKQRPGELLKPLGDQVILLNPAFEASRFYDLKQLARSVESYPAEQRPVLSVFQSEGDWATRDFFPIGQSVAALFQRHRSGFQKTANRQTVGWFEPFITHELVYDPSTSSGQAASTGSTGVAGTNAPATASAPTPRGELRKREKLPETLDNIMTQRQNWKYRQAAGTRTPLGSCTLISKPDYQPRNPILVVAVDKKIMKDHDDIGNPVLINFLQEYIPFCDNATPPAPVLSK